MRILVLGLIALLAACQPVPRPFQADRKAPTGDELAALGPRSGIVVVAPTGARANVTALLPGIVAEALLAQEVPATALASPVRRFSLRSHVSTRFTRAGRADIAVRWTLRDPGGAIFATWDQRLTANAGAWRLADTPLLEDLADGAAAKLTALIGPDAVDPRPPTERTPVLAIGSVEGAPGDGGPALAQALLGTLRLRGFDARLDRAPGSFLVNARVTLTPGIGGDRVDIVWSVTGPGGRDVGTVRQSNLVPTGTLDGAWGDVAFAIAEGAADGILEALQRSAATMRGAPPP